MPSNSAALPRLISPSRYAPTTTDQRRSLCCASISIMARSTTSGWCRSTFANCSNTQERTATPITSSLIPNPWLAVIHHYSPLVPPRQAHGALSSAQVGGILCGGLPRPPDPPNLVHCSLRTAIRGRSAVTAAPINECHSHGRHPRLSAPGRRKRGSITMDAACEDAGALAGTTAKASPAARSSLLFADVRRRTGELLLTRARRQTPAPSAPPGTAQRAQRPAPPRPNRPG